MKQLKNECRIFLTALMFFTRLPVPKNIDHHTADLNKSSRYFPLVGILVGSIGAVTFILSYVIFNDRMIASILSMGATVLTTGAFHEDGLADVADGFGGGWTRQKILDIMKDSRVGAFGVIALILVMGLKLYAISKLSALLMDDQKKETYFLFGLLYIAGHSVSRMMPVFYLMFMDYAREDDPSSKVKPLATHISEAGFSIALFFGMLPLLATLLLCDAPTLLWACLIPCGLLTLYLATYFNKWINGYTGDCLGATQQLNEVLFYASILALWNYIL